MKSNKIKFLFTLLGISLLLSGIVQAADIEVNAYVDRNQVTVEDIISFSVELKGNVSLPNVSLKGLTDFMVISGPSHSSRFEMVNGATTSSKTLTWHLSPKRTGNLLIPALEFTYKRKKYETKPIRITVSGVQVQNNSGKTNNTEKNSDLDKYTRGLPVFLKAIPNKKNAFYGEEIVVDFILYFRVQVRDYKLDKKPDARNFWTEEFKIRAETGQRKETIDGIVYSKALLYRIAYFPTAAGKQTIDPMELTCEVILPRKRGNDPFQSLFDDPFFGDAFGRGENKPVKSNPVEITVHALPESSKPMQFSGLVGEYKITSSIDTLEISQDEAVTLKYNIQGTGNINTFNTPKLDLPEYVDVFDPKIDKRINRKGNNVSGHIDYEFVLIPRKSGSLEIPQQEFWYFNPAKNRYEKTIARGFTVTVKSKEQKYVSSGSGLSRTEIQMLGEDIRFINRERVNWQHQGDSVFRSISFWGINTLSVLIIVCSLLLRLHLEKLETNITFARQRKAFAKSQQLLKIAEKALSDSDNEAVLTNLEKCLIGFISDRLGLPPSGMGISELDDVLVKTNIGTDDRQKCIGFLNSLEQARFAPGMMTSLDYGNFVETGRELLKILAGKI